MPDWLYWLGMLLILVAFVWMRRPGIKPAEARRLVGEGARLLDVRSPAEFAGGHIDGALNIPVGELGSRLHQVGPKDRVVIVYCASGARSAAAKRKLRSAGYTTVHNLGAMSNWLV